MKFLNWLFKKKEKKETILKTEFKEEISQSFNTEEDEIAAVIGAVIASIDAPGPEENIIAAIAAAIFAVRNNVDAYEISAIVAGVMASMEEELKEVI